MGVTTFGTVVQSMLAGFQPEPGLLGLGTELIDLFLTSTNLIGSILSARTTQAGNDSSKYNALNSAGVR